MQFAPIEKTGLSVDYLNAWYCLSVYYERVLRTDTSDSDEEKAEMLALLNKPMQTYEEYFAYFYPDELEKAMDSANPNALNLLNKTVTEFNALDQETRIQYETYKKYAEECRRIIEG